MKTNKNKDFDCIEMKRKAQAKIYERIKGMTPEQEISYYRQSIEKSEFAEWWKSTRSGIKVTERH